MYQEYVDEMRGRKLIVDKAIKFCLKCRRTWGKVSEHTHRVSYVWYAPGHIPTIGKEKTAFPKCKNK